MLELLLREASKRKGWTEYAQYCASRIKGDRKTALKHLKTFTSTANKWDFSKRREFAVWLLAHLEPYPITNQCPALEEPFVSSFLRPTLETWASESKLDDARPLRWLGMFFQDESTEKHLARAIDINAQEQLARITLLGKIFDRAWDETDTNTEVDKMSTLIEGIDDEPTRVYWKTMMEKLKKQ